MASCPVCSSRLPAQSISSELVCRACGARLKCNPYAAGLLALALGGVPAGILMSVDHSWPWFVMGLVAFIVGTCAGWRILLKVERRLDGERVSRGARTPRPAPAPWHLWVIGVIALLWSAMGATDYVMTQTRNEAYMSEFSPKQLAFFDGIPAWVIAAWAIGVWGGVIGALLLLFRRPIAVWVFLASLLAIVVTTFHNYHLSNGMEVMGDAFSPGFAAAIFLVALGLFLYARAMHRQGVLA